MNMYEIVQSNIKKNPKTWLVTGVAGFIGSNLLEALLKLDQHVCGLDNFSTGHQRNLDDVQSLVTSEQWGRFQFLSGDIRNIDDCRKACHNVSYVLHQAALGSVPRSIADPLNTHHNNVDGFLNMLVAARDAQVSRFVYASSSSTYGNHPDLPKVEEKIGQPMSPYAITKLANELYADVFAHHYKVESIGLRYFNVFGRRQDPQGAYAAVIPKWIGLMLENKPVAINGKGDTSRDFCYIQNAVQANLLAAITDNKEAINQVYNVAVGDQTSLINLHEKIRLKMRAYFSDMQECPPIYQEYRAGDIRHSRASIKKASERLGYVPTDNIDTGLDASIEWYVRSFQNHQSSLSLRSLSK